MTADQGKPKLYSPLITMGMLRKLFLIGGATTLVSLVAIQFMPVKKVERNPMPQLALDAPPEVERIFRRACMDCHSNETVWPLYTSLAPGSWLMAEDVSKGRSRMNVSAWGEIDEEERTIDRENAWEQIESGEMPPWFYVWPLHLDARLSDADKALLKQWLLRPAASAEKKSQKL